MTEAIFGLLGVLLGSAISWFQTYRTNKSSEEKNAKYLAIRMVCILDKFLEDCASVVTDDGLSYGQRNSEGCLEPQVKAPGPPVYPGDVDWRSIDHELMYKLLSFPSEIEAGDRMVKHSADIATPPDYEEWFEERKYHYAQFGLQALKLSKELCKKYRIKEKTYNDWNPSSELQHQLQHVLAKRQKRLTQYQQMLNQTFKS